LHFGQICSIYALTEVFVNMFPPGFPGSRAAILIDIVTLSFIIILPILIISWRLARIRKDYGQPSPHSALSQYQPVHRGKHFRRRCTTWALWPDLPGECPEYPG